jgi:Cft2 family RNA processing exonuclease
MGAATGDGSVSTAGLAQEFQNVLDHLRRQDEHLAHRAAAMNRAEAEVQSFQRQTLALHSECEALKVNQKRLEVAASTRSASLEPVEAAARVLLQALDSGPLAERGGKDDATGRAAETATQSGCPVQLALATTGIDENRLRRFLGAILVGSARAEPPPARTRYMGLKVTPLGGGREIGGSCILVEAGGTRILVDVGMRPGGTTHASMAPPRIKEALAGKIDAVVLTHAHNDHCGYVPALMPHHPSLRIICTPATKSLLPDMWEDTCKVLERRHQEQLEKERGGATNAPKPAQGSDQLLYGPLAAGAAVRRLEALPFGVPERFRDLIVELFPAGHVLGAAGVVVSAGEQRVVITGDISTRHQLSVRDLAIPSAAKDSDLLVIESTYCRDDHRPHADTIADFLRVVSYTLKRGGRVLVPAFALGRAQEVALLLREHLPDERVLIDGMAKRISRIYQRASPPDAREIFVGGVEECGDRTSEIRSKGPLVIVTTAGMFDAGPALAWAPSILSDPHSAMLFTGYQAAGSRGHRLLQAADCGVDRFPVDEQPIEISAEISQYSLSAHADRSGLESVIDTIRADAVMLVHGEAVNQDAFAARLRDSNRHPVPTKRWSMERATARR